MKAAATNSVIVLIGPAGSGKSVQAELLAHHLQGAHLSSGEILRMTAGPKIQAEMRRGERPAEPEVGTDLAAALAAAPADQAWVLDGFVLLQSDLTWLETTLQRLGRRLSHVIFLDVPEAETTRRLLGRGRADDTPEVMAERRRQYEAETLPLIEALSRQGIVRQVNGVGTVEEVAARVMAAAA